MPEAVRFKDFETIYATRGAYHRDARGFSAWFLEANYRAIVKHCRGAKRILDIGCGEGCLVDYLESPPSDGLVGVDCSPEAIALAAKLSPGRYDQLLVGDLRTLSELALPAGSFDTVVCSLALMYVMPDDLAGVLGGIAELLADDGLLVATYPTVGPHRKSAADAAELPPRELVRAVTAAGYEIAELSPFCPFVTSAVVEGSNSDDPACVAAAKQAFETAREEMTVESSYHFLCVARKPGAAR
ncbi:MAG: class I SAM-dependent methyltransferase [Myxococcales bacterium]|nr:class I SAM-dependent methyltransferase [Myxococcales bacterium]